MKKIRNIFIILLIAGTAGMVYAISTFRNFPDTLDWDDDDE